MSSDSVANGGANGDKPQGSSDQTAKTAQTLPPIPPNAHRFVLTSNDKICLAFDFVESDSKLGLVPRLGLIESERQELLILKSKSD
jgi:hypothetical protein